MATSDHLAAVLAAGQRRPVGTGAPKPVMVSWDLMPPLPQEVLPLRDEIKKQILQAYDAYQRNENGVLAKGHIKILFDLPPPAGPMEIQVYSANSRMQINWVAKHALKNMPTDNRYIDERLRYYYMTLSKSSQRELWPHWTPQKANFRWVYFADHYTRVNSQSRVVPEMPPPPAREPSRWPTTGDGARREAEAAASLLGLHGNRHVV